MHLLVQRCHRHSESAAEIKVLDVRVRAIRDASRRAEESCIAAPNMPLVMEYTQRKTLAVKSLGEPAVHLKRQGYVKTLLVKQVTIQRGWLQYAVFKRVAG